MNRIDRSIAAVSPKWALARLRARIGLQYAEKFSYDGARSGRRTDGWSTGISDANTELLGSLSWLRNRSRDLVRNNPYASKAINELVGNTVGTGITAQAKTGDPKLDQVIDTEWQYFSESIDPARQFDFYGLQALVCRTTAESGEGIARFRPRLLKDNLRVPLQVQILESDYIDSFRTMAVTAPVAGHIIQGVQFDQIGQRLAYWLFKNHPGAPVLMYPGGMLSEPVPADQILHNYRILRPGQVRGVPWLAPVMMALRDLEDYREAERVRKKIEACVVAFVTQPEGESGPPLGATRSVDPRTGNILESFEPGAVEYMRPGEDVKFNNPPAMGGYTEYLRTELHGISSGVEVPYEMLSGDLSQVNYSSYRAGMLGFRNIVDAYRWLTLIPMFCQPIRRRFIDTLVLTALFQRS